MFLFFCSISLAPQERLQQRTVEETVEVQEIVEIVKIVPQEQSSERTPEQFRVIEVSEASSQDRSWQGTVELALGDFVEVDRTIPQDEFHGLRLSQCRREGVEVVKKVSQERISGRIYERSEVIDSPGKCRGSRKYSSGANFCKEL